MGSFMSAPVWAQGLVDVLGVKSSSPLSQGLDVRKAEKQFNTEVRFGLVAGLTDEPLTGGDSPSEGEDYFSVITLDKRCQTIPRLICERFSIPRKIKKSESSLYLLPLYSGFMKYYYFFFLSFTPTKAAIPVPKRNIVAGSGTVAVLMDA